MRYQQRLLGWPTSGPEGVAARCVATSPSRFQAMRRTAPQSQEPQLLEDRPQLADGEQLLPEAPANLRKLAAEALDGGEAASSGDLGNHQLVGWQPVSCPWRYLRARELAGSGLLSWGE